MKISCLRLITAALLTVLPPAIAAEYRGEDGLGTVEVGTTLMAVADNEWSVGDERGLAFDVYTTVPTGRGNWSLLVEAATHSLTGQSPDGAAPAGSNGVWDPARSGDARLAEFHYSFETLGGEWSLGLLDSKVHIDGSAVANDDKEHFMGAAFVNNPAIDIPANSLGMAYRRAPGLRAPSYTVLMAASKRYRAETGAPANSLFLALEAARGFGGLTGRLGAWANGDQRFALPGQNSTRQDHGFYASLDGQFSRLAWNLRTGTARVGGTARESFLGAATQIPLRQSILGIGVGLSRRRGEALSGARGHTSHVEIFYRFMALGRFIVTPDIQYQRIEGTAGTENMISACVRLRVVM